MTPCSIEIDAISKRFGDHQALNAISLAVRAGEFVSILGPSGCGKSTLLRLIAGLDDPDAGDIRVAGRSMATVGPRDRGVAFVFQNYALYPHLSGYDNIAAPLVMRELNGFERLPGASIVPSVARKRRSIDDRVRAIAQLLQVDPWLARRPGQLSGGQRQRIALGRALVREPSLFLLDEPFANLDAALRHQTRAELAALQKRLGTTTIFVTHDQSEAMAMSDRIAVMFDGNIRQVATPDELYRNPADLDVARFLSQPHLNCLPAKVVANGWVMIGGERVALSDANLPGGEGIVGFRPEHATLKPRHAHGALPAIVERVEHAGAEVHVFVRLAMLDAPCVVRAGSQELSRWTPGTSCWVALDATSGWFFPRRPAQASLRHIRAVEAA
jgi:multiple sugar transport system ATP-binding protein